MYSYSDYLKKMREHVCSEMRKESPNYILPEDGGNICFTTSQNEMIIAKGHHVIKDLLPQPVIGNIEKALIYICTCNPGYDKNDYIVDEKYRKVILQQLDQTKQNSLWFLTEEDQFMYDNANINLGGAQWWQKKFLRPERNSLVKKILEACEAKNPHCSKEEILKRLSELVVAVDLFPYHSVSKPCDRVFTCESSERARDFIFKKIKPQAEKGEKLLLFMRSKKLWEKGRAVSLQNGKNGNIYVNPYPRAISFSGNCEAGKMIFEFLNKKTNGFLNFF